MITFVVYQCLSTKTVQTKQTQLVPAFFTKSIYSHPQLWKNKKGGIVRGRSTLRDPIYCIFFLCVPFLRDSVPYQFLENRNEQSCTQFSGLRSRQRALAWISFSDSLQWVSSATLYLKDYPFCCNWWNFILFNGRVIILLKIYKHAFLQTKYPCFTQDLGPPSSRQLQSPGPSLPGAGEAFHSWQRSWGRRFGIRKGGIEPQESARIFSSIYPPKKQSLPTLLLCALTSDFTGGCPLPPSRSLCQRVNLQLQLIKFLGN